MTKLFKKVSFFLSMLLILLFYYPISDNVIAEAIGGELQNTVLQSSFGMEFQAFPAQTINAVIKDKLAFVTAGINGLMAVDISDKAKLRQTAYLGFAENVSLIGIYGSHIYLPARNNLYVVDASDPLHPSCILEIPMNSEKAAVSMAIDSNRMYLADDKSISIYLLDNPAVPLLLTSFSLDNQDGTIEISDIAVRNETAYVACGQNGIGIYNFSDVNNIVNKGQYISSGGYSTGVYFWGNNALVSVADKNIVEILNVSDVEKPEFTGAINSIQSIICTEDNTAYVVNDLGCLSIADLSPYAPPPVVKDDNIIEPRDKNQKVAYITIDDGPSRSITPMNLDTLKKYGVKATFFVLPRTGVEDIYKRIIDEGHVIGNHSYSHDYDYLYGSTDNFKKDVLKAKQLIYKKLEYTSTVFRFPGGTMGRSKSNIKARADILSDLGYRYFDWDVSTADTDPNLKKYGNEEQIVNLLANNVIKNAKERKKLIILMHDSAGKLYSAKALPKIIEGLEKQGYVFDVLTNY